MRRHGGTKLGVNNDKDSRDFKKGETSVDAGNRSSFRHEEGPEEGLGWIWVESGGGGHGRARAELRVEEPEG